MNDHSGGYLLRFIVVALYVAVGMVCLYVGTGIPRRRRPDMIVWTIAGLVLVVLAVCRLADLQAAAGHAAQTLARQNEWYAQRRVYQTLFIAFAGTTVIGAVAMGTWLWPDLVRRNVWAVVGLCLLVLFTLVRATSLHGIDYLLGLRAGPVKISWVFEIGLLGWILAAAVFSFLRSRRGTAG